MNWGRDMAQYRKEISFQCPIDDNEIRVLVYWTATWDEELGIYRGNLEDWYRISYECRHFKNDGIDQVVNHWANEKLWPDEDEFTNKDYEVIW